jgi:hypothetical protein
MENQNIRKFILKQLKSIAYASAGGSLVIGSAQVDLINADAWTIIYMVVAAVGFNVIKEMTKNGTNSNNGK